MLNLVFRSLIKNNIFGWVASTTSWGPNENQLELGQGSVVGVLRFKSTAAEVFQQYGDGHHPAT
jgi:hypothetical protein